MTFLSRRTPPQLSPAADRGTLADALPRVRRVPFAQVNSASVTLGVATGFLLLSATLAFLPDGGTAASAPTSAALGLRGPLPGPLD